ncbi:hypothetical protein Back11_43350 [Paenibacillus baekrokdamisoli]|uniref:Uncharacterized protein n=1 Tax=Paenibacillus baekrokdamisoli TaxID=1712516 RepID=A0A3G9IVX7_9BACL|nr:phosphatase PAP2 family protein [Paenibacillus baekrokdamisoli]MBB3067962.1 undecaprenyl-diphosphatase [Paenibacillus baekrokdamisoli]BBH22990.1 hypothetical protein Back11_43350 [Paenibacillus baekrokdamisoli]
MFNSLDNSFIEWLNHHSFMSPFINKIIHVIADRDEFKGLIFMLFFWSLWFYSSKNKTNQKILLGTLLACFVSLLISRSITELIENRPRPMINPVLGFQTPIGLTSEILPKMSSFPSDHAALYFGLSIGFALISKRIGGLLFAYTSLFIVLPRFYLGYHYPSDIITGLLIGFICIYAIIKNKYLQPTLDRIVQWETIKPAIFYPCLFLTTYEFSTMFDNIRHFASLLLHHGF